MTVNAPLGSAVPPPPAPEAARGPRVGVLLRRTREDRRIVLADAAATLRIREYYLEAIEAGAYDRLPGKTYVIGFVRAYAEYLGIDGEEAVRIFKREAPVFESERNLSLPAPIESRNIPGGRVLITGLVLAVCGYGLWSYLGARHGADAVAPVPPSLGGDTATPSEAKAAVREPGDPSARPPQAKPLAAAAPAPVPVTPARIAPAAPVASSSAPTPSGAPPPQRLALAGATVPAAPPAPIQATADQALPGHVFGLVDGPARIVLRFTADCWMQVRGADSDMSSGRLMHAGDVYRVPDHPGLAVRVGNSDAVAIALDGKPVKLPPAPSLVQTIALDPDRLANGTAAVTSHGASGRANRAAAAVATAAAAHGLAAPARSDEARPRRAERVSAPVGPPPDAMAVPPPPPNMPAPPDDND